MKAADREGKERNSSVTLGALGVCLGLSATSLCEGGAGFWGSVIAVVVGLIGGLAVGPAVHAFLWKDDSANRGQSGYILRAFVPLWFVGAFALAASVSRWRGIAFYGIICCAAASLGRLADQEAPEGRDVSGDSHARRIMAACLAVCFLLFYQGVFLHDAHQYFGQLSSIVLEKSLQFYDDIWVRNSFRTFNPFPFGSARYIGVSIAQLPFFVVGLLLDGFLGILSNGAHVIGRGEVTYMVTGAADIFYGAAGMAICWLLLRTWFGCRVCVFSVMVCALASPLIFFMFIWNGWPHALSFCLVAAFLLVWVRTRDFRGPVEWAGLGVLAGWIALIRPVDLIACCVLLPDITRAFKGGRRGWLCLLGFACAAMLAFMPQVILWKNISGRWLPEPYAEIGDRFNWFKPDLTGLLFSSVRHGLIAWNPVFAVGLGGLMYFARRDRRVAFVAAMAIALLTYSISSWSVWWTGTGFGNRFFVSFLPLFALGVAAAAEFAAARIGWAWVSVMGGVLVAANILLMSAYSLQVIPQGIPEPSLITDYSLSFWDLMRMHLGMGFHVGEAITEGAIGQGPPILGRMVEAAKFCDFREIFFVALFSLLVVGGIWLTFRIILGNQIQTKALARFILATGAIVTIAVVGWVAFVCDEPVARNARFYRLEFEPMVLDAEDGCLRIPSLCPFPVVAVDVVSSLEYAHCVKEGEAVAVISVTDSAGSCHKKILRAGIDTAEGSFFRPETRRITRHSLAGVDIVRQRPTRTFSTQRYPLLAFRSVVELPEPKVVSRVEIEYTSSVGRMRLEDIFLRDFPCR